ncbi:MAG: disulfide bond formation protein B [Parvibaculales bacterium]
MFKRLKDWVVSLTRHKYAVPAMATVSFTESSFFLVPPDVMLAPMAMANKNKAWRLAFICTLASTLGAVLGYAIGLALFEAIGQPIIESYDAQDEFDKFLFYYDAWGGWVVFISAVSFIPFKLATIASGVVGLNPLVFVLASLVGRGLRFYLVTLAMVTDPRKWLADAKIHLSLLWLGMAGVIVLALLMQHVGGYQPCAMCLTQRLPYYAGLLAVPLIGLAVQYRRDTLYQYGLIAVSLMFTAGAAYAAYHAGVEWKWWPGPDTCAATGAGPQTIDQLMNSLQNDRLVPCDDAPWRLFGISMAGYNTLASCGLAAFALWPFYGDAVLNRLNLQVKHDQTS